MVTPENRSQGEQDNKALLSPGKQLRQAREAMGASLSVVAARTRITETTLFHLENDMFDEFAVELFLRGHLKSYARELGLDPNRIIRAYEQEIGYTKSCQLESLLCEEESDLNQESSGAQTNLNDASLKTLDEVRQSLSGSSDAESSEGKSLKALQVTNVKSSSNLRNTSGLRRATTLNPKFASAIVEGKNRKVIGRNSTQIDKNDVRRGPGLKKLGKLTGESSKRDTLRPLSTFTKRIFSRTQPNEPVRVESDNVVAKQQIRFETYNGFNTKQSPQSLRTSNQLNAGQFGSGMGQTHRHNALAPQSKLDRAIPQLKQFGAKHYLAILALLAATVIAAGLLSGNRATAQDTAKFPKNSQDSWELERQAEQTRWLLEQPDGQVDVQKNKP